MAAARQTLRHADNERVRQFIQQCWHGWSGALPPGQSPTTASIAIIPVDTHVVDISCG
ncbi:hypothetical protein [Chloroflexus sp.]|uniref:hypothetical protein n=1 Tax=Chloroflexus sp. TaxID=1904827 RepID=UPI00257EE45B|nr:hypothetical protein [Chloroflexus sp.]